MAGLVLVENPNWRATNPHCSAKHGRDGAADEQSRLRSFDGWSPQADGNGDQYTDAAEKTQLRSRENAQNHQGADVAGDSTKTEPSHFGPIGVAPTAPRHDEDHGEGADQGCLRNQCWLDHDEHGEGQDDHSETNNPLEDGANKEGERYKYEGPSGYMHLASVVLSTFCIGFSVRAAGLTETRHSAVEYEQIRLDIVDRIATITLDRPDRLNAFTGQMVRELIDVFDRTDQDDEVRVVVVTGAGRGFCAGADLESGGDTFDTEAQGRSLSHINRDGGGQVTMRIFDSLKPVIAAINGPAVGIGITMTLPMDLRFAAESAKIGFVFTRRGITLEAASSWFLPRLVGMSQAAEWCYTGRVMTATEAGRGGLVQVVPDDELLDRVYELAREIAVHAAPVSAAVTRRLLWRGLTFDHPMQAHRADSRAIQSLGRSADAVEGVTSFLEKREPRWTMSASSGMPDLFPWVDEPVFE